MTEEDARRALGQWISQRRQDLRLSLRAAARLAGIDRATWTGIEDGSRQTQDTKYAAIEDALQLPRGSIAAKLREEPAPTTAPRPGSLEWWDNLSRVLPPDMFWEVVQAKLARGGLPKRLAERYESHLESQKRTQSRA